MRNPCHLHNLHLGGVPAVCPIVFQPLNFWRVILGKKHGEDLPIPLQHPNMDGRCLVSLTDLLRGFDHKQVMKTKQRKLSVTVSQKKDPPKKTGFYTDVGADGPVTLVFQIPAHVLVFWVGFLGSKYLQTQDVWKPRVNDLLNHFKSDSIVWRFIGVLWCFEGNRYEKRCLVQKSNEEKKPLAEPSTWKSMAVGQIEESCGWKLTSEKKHIWNHHQGYI